MATESLRAGSLARQLAVVSGDVTGSHSVASGLWTFFLSLSWSS